MKPHIIFISPEMDSSEIVERLKRLDNTVVVFGKPEHNFSEIPKLTVGDELNFAETYPDPTCEDNLPPEKTCPPYEWGQKKRKRKSR